MNIFIAGICGTFMAGIAQLAQTLGHRVRGCDAHTYPPMSDVLTNVGIEVQQGYQPAHLDADTDQVIIGNALSRGNPLVEAVLNRRITYRSGPEWLAEHVLPNYRVIAVAGTHGKTSTASMVAWILEYAGQNPGFLIGGKPENFTCTARMGKGEDFVIEADEYDTAFFDKRSKFLHYSPQIAVLNNLEFDHADIFDSLSQIQRQFHQLIRIIPGNGRVIVNCDDRNLEQVLDLGLWSKRVDFALENSQAVWRAVAIKPSAQAFDIMYGEQVLGSVHWNCIGSHNMHNALAAIVTSCEAGVPLSTACAALGHYRANQRRLQCLYESAQMILFEDFAHHPTAIAHTLDALRTRYPDYRLVAIVEPRSNTMRLGHAPEAMGHAMSIADETIVFMSRHLSWDPASLPGKGAIRIISEPEQVIAHALEIASGKTVFVAMSNGSFDGIPEKLKTELQALVH